MKKVLLLFCVYGSLNYVNAQPNSFADKKDSVKIEKSASLWIKNLYEMGIEKVNDSIKMNEECKRILSDSAYRKIVYPQNYSWEATTYLLKSGEFKKAFWYLINLYESDTANKLMVLRSIVPFDQLMQMDKVLTSTFYTYALLNPKVSTISNGRYQIMHPDVLENQFTKMKEMISYILYYRKKSIAKRESDK